MTTDADPANDPLIAALQSLIRDDDLERLEDLLADFNLFDVLGISPRELQHSAFLAWLLNPLESHGLRDYFLPHFLSQAAAEATDRGIPGVTPLDVDGWKFNTIDVTTERDNIDILVVDEEDGFACLIENKINSGEHSDQLRRYLDTVEGQYGDLVRILIFLTPDGIEPESPDDAESWVPFDYERIATLIRRTLENRRSTICPSVVSFMEQYVRTLERHVLATSDNIEELARRLYAKHPAATDLIIAAKSDNLAPVFRVFDSVLETYAPELLPDLHHKNYYRFFSSSLEGIDELQGPPRWTKSGRLLLFQFTEARALHLYVGPGDYEVRQCMRRLAQEQGAPFRVANKFGRTYG